MSDGFNSLIMSFLSELNSHLAHALFVTLSLSDRRHINFMGDDEKIKISVISRLSPYCLTKFCSEDIQMPSDKASWMERRRKASLTVCRGGLREPSLIGLVVGWPQWEVYKKCGLVREKIRGS